MEQPQAAAGAEAPVSAPAAWDGELRLLPDSYLAAVGEDCRHAARAAQRRPDLWVAAEAVVEAGAALADLAESQHLGPEYLGPFVERALAAFSAANLELLEAEGELEARDWEVKMALGDFVRQHGDDPAQAVLVDACKASLAKDDL